MHRNRVNPPRFSNPLIPVVAGILIVACTANTVSAQDRPRIGVFANVTFGTVNWEQNPGLELLRLIRPGVGAGVELPLSATASLDARLEWARRGARGEGPGEPVVDMSAEIDQLVAPLLLKVGSRGPLRVFGIAGPEVAMRLTSRYTLSALGEAESGSLDEDLHRWDVGLRVGAGIERGGFLTEVSYTHGLRNLLVDDADSLRVRTWAWHAGVRF